jgi:hypothetical protein
MPPIPEDAVVLADYMLMADFVGQGAGGVQYISKGVRSVSSTRDVFVGGTGSAATVVLQYQSNHGFYLSGSTSTTWRLPAFCTNFVLQGYDADYRNNIFVDTTNKNSVATHTTLGSYGDASYLSTGNELTLGINKIGNNCVASDGNWGAYNIATPIHTSSHYQSFETPFLHELVGGDRNMEQTNLVVTPDGKTWDEVTRDTSYIGNVVLSAKYTGGDLNNAYVSWDEWRGIVYQWNSFNKDSMAIAYDRVIVLKDGYYHISMYGNSAVNGQHVEVRFRLNGNTSNILMGQAAGHTGLRASANVEHRGLFKRGDYFQFYVYQLEGELAYLNGLQIQRLN